MIKYVFNPFTNNLDAVNYTEAVAPKMAGIAVDGTAVNINYASFTPLVISGTDIEVTSPVNVVGSTTPLLAIITFRVQNPAAATAICAFKFRIYNVNDGVAVINTETTYQSYLLPASETAESTFTFHMFLMDSMCSDITFHLSYCFPISSSKESFWIDSFAISASIGAIDEREDVISDNSSGVMWSCSIVFDLFKDTIYSIQHYEAKDINQPTASI